MHASIAVLHYPHNAKELIALLEKGRGKVAPVGGGVSFSFFVPPKVSELASMRALGLDGIALDGKGLRLGALVTIAALTRSARTAKFMNGLLAQAASRVAATTNRNLITVGGNAVRLFIWSDLPVVYCAAGAVFMVRGKKGVRRISCEEFYRAQPLSRLSHSEYLEEILIPTPAPRTGAAFEKFSETENTFALASAAACVTLDRAGRCASARLVIGGLQLLPRASTAARDILLGRAPSPELAREAAGAAVREIKPVRDIRVSAGYKKELAVVMARRALEKAFAAAAGKR